MSFKDWFVADPECFKQNLPPGSCVPEGALMNILILVSIIAVTYLVLLVFGDKHEDT